MERCATEHRTIRASQGRGDHPEIMAQARRDERGEPGQGPGCPICGKPPAEAVRPFCSRRCADVDLGRWLGGTYVLPARDDDDEAPRA
jgi:endogenous inhibitor of DNA gyrase (YacG/DUF329 family)